MRSWNATHCYVSSYMVFGALVHTFIFRDVANGHFGFGPLAKMPGIVDGPLWMGLYLC